MTQLTVWGGAGEHGRSCYLISEGGLHILLDCGVKKTGSGQYPLLDGAIVPQLSAVFLSHAHEDHSIAIPLLYKMGYTGQVWTTRETVQQLNAYFSSWKKYVNSRPGSLPYGEEDIAAIRYAYLEDEASANNWWQAAPGLQCRWGRSGHMIGSVWLELELKGKRVFYSGDYSRESSLLEADLPGRLPEARPNPEADRIMDLSIVDAAYALDEQNQADKLSLLEAAVGKALAAGGSVLLPVPAFGRGQELLLWAMDRFPGFGILAEQELLDGLEQLAGQGRWLRPEAVERINDALKRRPFTVVCDQAGREAVMAAGFCGLIFACDGMMHSAVSQWYYREMKGSPAHCVILTGHLAEGSFAKKLLRATPGEGGFCRVLHIGYKVHQGLPDVRRMLAEVPSRLAVPVHAAIGPTRALCRRLEAEGFRGVTLLEAGDRLEF